MLTSFQDRVPTMGGWLPWAPLHPWVPPRYLTGPRRLTIARGPLLLPKAGTAELVGAWGLAPFHKLVTQRVDITHGSTKPWGSALGIQQYEMGLTTSPPSQAGFLTGLCSAEPHSGAVEKMKYYKSSSRFLHCFVPPGFLLWGYIFLKNHTTENVEMLMSISKITAS